MQQSLAFMHEIADYDLEGRRVSTPVNIGYLYAGIYLLQDLALSW